MTTGNGGPRNSDVIGVGNVSGRNENDAHVRRAAAAAVHFGTELVEAIPAPRSAPGEGRRPVVTEPSPCRAARYEGPSPVHLVLSVALLFFAVAVSML